MWEDATATMLPRGFRPRQPISEGRMAFWTARPAGAWRLAAVLHSEMAAWLRQEVQSVVRAMRNDHVDRSGLVALLDAA